MKRFALIGAAGFIAERHMKAIKETGNDLVCAFDCFDVMGRMDSYFPNAEFFLKLEDLGKHMNNLTFAGTSIDYLTICTPNYLHASHIRFALSNGANAICEKPLVIYPNDLQLIKNIENETGKKVFSVLQLRHHQAIIQLKNEIDNNSVKKYDIDLSYITSRGKWYLKSWKGDPVKSGGLVTNIGIHFFDMLTWVFGKVQNSVVHIHKENKAAGFLELEKANVRWFLSLDAEDLPVSVKEKGLRTFRSIKMGGKELEFSEGFTDLHTETYRNILAGKGFGIDDAMESIILADTIRNAEPVGIKGEIHPFLLQKR